MAETITIAGAGPAGLAAAIYLARGGRKVRVLERAPHVGSRFFGDQQGIENWSRKQDALDELSALGIRTSFTSTAVNQIHYTGPARQLVELKDSAPFFYLVRRGNTAGSLDCSLYEQALAAGVEVQFGRRCAPDRADIMATGPRGISGVALGYVFATDSPPQALLFFDNELAPGGYAYLLISNGCGTLATTFPRNFRLARLYLQRTVAAATALVGLRMHQPRLFGGRGHFYLAQQFRTGFTLISGEAAGLQDFFMGFGIRYALLSGILAARSILEHVDYEDLIRSHFHELMQTSVVNRFAFEQLGNRQLDWLCKIVARVAEPRAFLYRRYRPSWKKRLLFPLACWRLGARLRQPQIRL